MKVAIMQPYIFPYIGYFQLINAVDEFVVYDDVNFMKGSWINRNNILADNNSQLFSIPLVNASSFKCINEIKIFTGVNWQRKLLRNIEFSYKKAPFFSSIYPLLEEIILNDETNLSRYLMSSLQKVAGYLKMDTTFKISSELNKDIHLKGQDKVINICNGLEATNYINAIGGLDLYDKSSFETESITLNFLKTKDTCYPQFGNNFVPHLSIIDVMMFNNVDEIQSMLNQYELI